MIVGIFGVVRSQVTAFMVFGWEDIEMEEQQDLVFHRSIELFTVLKEKTIGAVFARIRTAVEISEHS